MKIDHIQNQFKEHINISEEVTNFIASEAKTNIGINRSFKQSDHSRLHKGPKYY